MTKTNKRKALLLLTAAVLVLASTVGGTIAYLFTSTGTVKNIFEPAKVVPVIRETFDEEKTEKTDVSVSNDGTVDAYIRATYVVNWKKAGGSTDEFKPIAEDQYFISMADNTGWFRMGDYFYFDKPVKPAYATDILIELCRLADGVTPPEGYSLNVEILAQAVQAEGVNGDGDHPVELAWSVKVNDNGTPNDYSDDTITAPSGN